MNKPTSEPVSVGLYDDILGVLANERSRHAIRSINELQTPVTLAELAEDVAARASGTPAGKLPPEAVERTHVLLFHVRVPTLAQAGLVDYDAESGTVAPTKRCERAERLLDAVGSTAPNVV